MSAGTTAGRVEVIAGPMFAGKSEELLRRVRRARIAGRVVEVAHHALDARRGAGTVSSHSGLGIAAHAVPTARAAEVLADRALRRSGLDLLAVDEAQFFGPGLVDVVQRIADRGVLVIVAGLDVTFDGRPFEPLPALGALAESVTKLTAVCAVCGGDAVFHVRLSASAGDPLAALPAHVGGPDSYQARCRRHLDVAPWRHSTSGTKL